MDVEAVVFVTTALIMAMMAPCCLVMKVIYDFSDHQNVKRSTVPGIAAKEKEN